MCSIRHLFLLIPFLRAFAFAGIDSDDELTTYSYPGKVIGERRLQICKEHEVCSIIHKRFWFPVQVERLCRCDVDECPSAWSDQADNYTMNLNTRAQMKFCYSIAQLPLCTDTNVTGFLHVENQTLPTQNSESSTTRAECYCPAHRKWVENRRFGNSSSNYRAYRCSKLPKCNEDELCGLESADNFEIYLQCSCPVGHMCTRRNNSEQLVEQLFYSGPAFKAFCTKYSGIALNITTNDLN